MPYFILLSEFQIQKITTPAIIKRLSHLGEALDTVRKSEYARLTGKNRRFIKGQKFTLLSHRENLTCKGRQSLKLLLKANKRLNTAYVLKEAFGQLWDYQAKGWARRFFENWCEALKWQRLGPYEKFAAMIDRHWDGIAAYANQRTKSGSASSKASTTKSGSFNDAPTVCATKSTCA